MTKTKSKEEAKPTVSQDCSPPLTPSITDFQSLIMEDPVSALRDIGFYYLIGEIDDPGLRTIQHDMLLKHEDRFQDDLTLMINSPGGSASAMWAMIDIMNWIGPDTRTIATGQACSAGAILLAAGTKGKRSATASCAIMIHQYSWGAAGTHSDLIASRKAQDDEHARHVAFWLKHSKYKSVKDVEKHLLNKQDVWLTAAEAKTHGIIDEIVRSKRW